MKDKTTVIMLAVKTPTITEWEKMDTIRKKIFDEIVQPFGCDPKVHRSESKRVRDVSIYFINKEGLLKRSVRTRLERTLERLKKYWPALVGYNVETLERKDA